MTGRNLRPRLARSTLALINPPMQFLIRLHFDLLYQAELHRFQPRPDDIYIVTYPKSGTTLLQMMLYQLMTDGDIEKLPHIETVSPWFEMELRRGGAERLEALPSPRFLKSHLRYDKIPRPGRYIYVARDLRGVALSAYYHLCLVTGAQQHPDEFLGEFLRGQTQLGSWSEHLRSWWPHRDDEDVLFLIYEDILADLEGTARRVAAFLDLGPPEERMPRVLERCSVEYMRRYSARFDPRLRADSSMNIRFIRKGRARGWEEELEPRQQARLVAEMRAVAEKLEGTEEGPHAKLFRP